MVLLCNSRSSFRRVLIFEHITFCSQLNPYCNIVENNVDIYIMVIHECHVLELRIGMNVHDHRKVLALLKQQRERPEKTEA